MHVREEELATVRGCCVLHSLWLARLLATGYQNICADAQGWRWDCVRVATKMQPVAFGEEGNPCVRLFACMEEGKLPRACRSMACSVHEEDVVGVRAR
ncbi:hypothetical protein CRYUN_Cryun06bG0071700 [Craigia yunnanensis]